ncbi:hypothetical protein [Georgenia sp. AZ-5]|uniref:hypothetical protein n=1 Tax=Georgenia sp. AZ-5 TaxID=3367526 RepID=UPI0037544820
MSVDEDATTFMISEEEAVVETYPDEEIAGKKYPWQRVSRTKVTVASGRLTIRALGAGYQPVRWADRKRWRLEDKLPDLFSYVEDQAASARERRERAAGERKERRLLWEQSVPEARRRLLGRLNAERAAKQSASWHEAERLRAYAAAVRDAASRAEDRSLSRRLAAWAGWIDREARRLDPLARPESVGFAVPESLSTYELDKYMPPGMTVRHPPGEEPERWR